VVKLGRSPLEAIASDFCQRWRAGFISFHTQSVTGAFLLLFGAR
jgi:hypothetical protein